MNTSESTLNRIYSNSANYNQYCPFCSCVEHQIRVTGRLQLHLKKIDDNPISFQIKLLIYLSQIGGPSKIQPMVEDCNWKFLGQQFKICYTSFISSHLKSSVNWNIGFYVLRNLNFNSIQGHLERLQQFGKIILETITDTVIKQLFFGWIYQLNTYI